MFIQLILAFFITVFSVLLGSLGRDKGVAKDVLQSATFITSLLLSAVVGLDSLFSPRKKWRNLRVASVSLESKIWKFRTRVGEFEDNMAIASKEERLEVALRDWREEFMMSSNSVRGRIKENDHEETFVLRRINDKGEASDHEKE